MRYQKYSNKEIVELYESYSPDEDHNGSLGMSIADEVFRRAGPMNPGDWIKYTKLPTKEKSLVNYVKKTDSLNLSPYRFEQKDRIGEKISLLKSIGVNRVYSKNKSLEETSKACLIEHAPLEQIGTIFEKYYFSGKKLMDELGLK